jgi:hypothetical protein
MLLIDVGGKVFGNLVHNFLDVGANLLVVSGDISAFGIVNKLVNVSGDVIIEASSVSAAFIAVVHAGLESVLIADVLNIAARCVDAGLS